MSDSLKRARAYIAALPPAISGQAGHPATYKAACTLVEFGLSDGDAWQLLSEWNRTHCQPPWSERELRHKLNDAFRKTAPSPRFAATTTRRSAPTPVDTATVKKISPEAKRSAKRYPVNRDASLPQPMSDGTRVLLKAAFMPGEGIRICAARDSDDGREVPKDGGIVLSLEEWLLKLDRSGGDPNKFIRTPERNGIFISLNPMKVGGSRDADVTAFRHALIEFDSISIAEQWGLISQSRIPCTCVISSGGKSLHAWVRVDAKDRREYDDRVKTLYGHFAEQQRPDEKNKNPSRFSRLANCMRGNLRQELLSLNLGAESWASWASDLETDGLGHLVRVGDLVGFDPASDSSCLLGKRWLCHGGSCLIVGQSGIGKSSLAVQLAATWAVARPAFGIAPARALKSLIIQAENDTGDLAEMVQGVVNSGEFDRQTLNENLLFLRDTTHTGYEFTQAVRRLIERHRPDLVWFDPYLSFLGEDISSQSANSEFLRNWLGPIAEATGVIWFLIHHTGKPSNDPKARAAWKSSDFAYSGIGSSEITNWPRAICVLQRFDEETFELKLAKRGRRAGATDMTGQPTQSLWLRHAPTAIRWEQVAEPEPKYSKAGREEKPFDLDGFIESLGANQMNYSTVVTRAAEFGAVSEATVKRRLWNTIKSRLTYDAEFKLWRVVSQ